MLNLDKLPNYWWGDYELVTISNQFGFEIYIFDNTRHKQITNLKDYIHLLSIDTSKIKLFNIDPCLVKMKPVY